MTSGRRVLETAYDSLSKRKELVFMVFFICHAVVRRCIPSRNQVFDPTLPDCGDSVVRRVTREQIVNIERM